MIRYELVLLKTIGACFKRQYPVESCLELGMDSWSPAIGGKV